MLINRQKTSTKQRSSLTVVHIDIHTGSAGSGEVGSALRTVRSTRYSLARLHNETSPGRIETAVSTTSIFRARQGQSSQFLANGIHQHVEPPFDLARKDALAIVPSTRCLTRAWAASIRGTAVEVEFFLTVG